MDCLNVCYKKIEKTSVHFDVYPPASLPTVNSSSLYPRIPAVVHFHPGGLTVGSRTSWFPKWLKDRIVAAGYLFISADYQLLPGATVYDIIDDIKDLFSFLAQDDLCFTTEAGLVGVDTTSMVVAGSSAGGLCGYLSALYASPKPKAVLSMYALGSNFLTRQWLSQKTEIWSRGRELLDPAKYSEFLYPNSKSLEPITESALTYHPADSPTPGWPSNPRMALMRLYVQLGVAIDYVTGQHEPSLCAQLWPLLDSDAAADPVALEAAMKAVIPAKFHDVFPQFNITSSFPPTFLCHGLADGAIPFEQSEHMQALLQKAGVPTHLILVEGANHSFEYVPDAEALYGSHFDEMAEFLIKALKPL
ncbi:Alpha/Beta hydrolase protein [Mycena crocata]|nr:Alpha/Beta hydrolase protein [Mycena crocata]